MILLILLSFFICVSTSQGASSEDVLAPASTYHFKAPIKKADGVWQSEDTNQNITLTMEKLDQNKKGVWLDRFKSISDHCEADMTQEEFTGSFKFEDSAGSENLTMVKRQSILNAVTFAKAALEIDDPYYDNGCVWMAFVASTDAGDRASEDVQNDFITQTIEMFVTVTVEPEAFSQHMGIARNPLYVGENHRALSLPIHSFAAQVAMQEYPSIRLFISAPLKKMRDILLKALGVSKDELDEQRELLIQPKDVDNFLYTVYRTIEDGRLKINGHDLTLPSWLGKVTFSCPISDLANLYS